MTAPSNNLLLGQRRIELHVDELVVDGLDASTARSLGAAVQAELARLLAAGGLPAVRGDRSVDRVDAGAVPLGRGLGSQVAQRVYRSIAR